MTRQEFYNQAVISAMQGLLAASGNYSDGLIDDPVDNTTNLAIQYAEALTLKVYGEEIVWPKERVY